MWGLAVFFAASTVAAFAGVTLSASKGPSAEWISTEVRPAVAVFIGDSYTAGAGVTDLDKRWTSIVSRRQRWTEVNLGRGGTGYILSPTGTAALNACGFTNCPSYTDMVADVAAANPDVVVVSGGRNEIFNTVANPQVFSLLDPKWPTGVEAFFVALRAATPRAQIVATSPIWSDERAPDALQGMRSTIQRAVNAVGGVHIDIGDPLLGRKDCMAPDGIHPNDAGHAVIAKAFLTAYTKKP